MIESRTAPLRVALSGGVLTISIGVETLAHATEYGQESLGIEFVITNQDSFAAAVLSELEREEEDGTTLVHMMFDEAAQKAIENGAEGIEC